MTRTRARGGFSSSYVNKTSIDALTGKVTNEWTAIGPGQTNGLRESVTDVSVVRFNRRMAQGEIYVNPFVLDRDLRTDPTETLVFSVGGWGTWVFTGTLSKQWSQDPVRPTWFADRVSNEKALILTKAHAKVGQETFQGMVTVAEARKTAKMLIGPFSDAEKLITKIGRRYTYLAKVLLKGRLPDARDLRVPGTAKMLAKAATNAWNEYRFGWKPVLKDIQGIIDAWAEQNRMAVHPQRVVARASSQVDWIEPRSVYKVVPRDLKTATFSRSTTVSTKVAAGVLYELFDESLLDATQRRMGLRLSDVPATIWELVPYSFVVDRFLAVGEWLQAITPKPNVRVLGSWLTTVEKSVCQQLLIDAEIDVLLDIGKPTQRIVNVHAAGGSSIERVTRVVREANPLLPVLPPINTRVLELEQSIDHAALITQRILNLLPAKRR